MENKSDKKRKMKLKTDYNKLYIGMHNAYCIHAARFYFLQFEEENSLCKLLCI